MPRPIPPSLGESITGSSEESDNFAAPATPEDILRVLGGTGLPGEVEIVRIEDVTPEPEPMVEPLEPEVEIIFTASEGIEKAETANRIHGAGQALDILKKTERTPESNKLNDDIIIEETQKTHRIYRAQRALDYLDGHKPRTPEARAIADTLYDQILIEGAKTAQRIHGSTRGLDYLDRHSPRTPIAQSVADDLYDKILIEGAEKKARINGKRRGLNFLSNYTPRTISGAQRVQQLQQKYSI